jgi:hypothetical protein
MNILLVVLKLMPSILAAVKAIEAAIPVSGAGKTKLELVLGVIEEVFSQTTSLSKEIPWETLKPIISGNVSLMVDALNNTGVFAKALQTS